MPSKTRSMPRQDATPLRSGRAFQDPSKEQERYLAAFLAAMVVGYHGIYVTRYAQSGAIKLKVYADGESYEDALETNEDWGPIFGDYSKRFGVFPHYSAILHTLDGAAIVRPAGAPEAGPEGKDTAPTPLRKS